MRAEEFIGRGNQKITTDVLYIHHTVRRILHSINEDQRASGLTHLSDFFDRVDRAEGVRGIPNCNQFRFFLQRLFQRVQFERAVFNVKINPLNIYTTLLSD